MTQPQIEPRYYVNISTRDNLVGRTDRQLARALLVWKAGGHAQRFIAELCRATETQPFEWAIRLSPLPSDLNDA